MDCYSDSSNDFIIRDSENNDSQSFVKQGDSLFSPPIPTEGTAKGSFAGFRVNKLGMSEESLTDHPSSNLQDRISDLHETVELKSHGEANSELSDANKSVTSSQLLNMMQEYIKPEEGSEEKKEDQKQQPLSA